MEAIPFVFSLLIAMEYPDPDCPDQKRLRDDAVRQVLKGMRKSGYDFANVRMFDANIPARRHDIKQGVMM